MDYNGYCNAALRKVALSGRNFNGVGSGDNVYFLTRINRSTPVARESQIV